MKVECIRKIWKKGIAGFIMLTIVMFLGRTIERELIAVMIQIVAGSMVYFSVLFFIKDSFMWNVMIPQCKNGWERLTKQKK